MIIPCFLATSSSVYFNQYGDFSGYWGPAFAIDGAQSNLGYNFFHSAHEPFPWIKITLPGATGTDTTVTLLPFDQDAIPTHGHARSQTTLTLR